jgi:RHS repeat-associated protein
MIAVIRNLLGQVRVGASALRSTVSAGLIVTLLCGAGIAPSKATVQAVRSMSVDRSVPRVVPPSELRFSSPPTDEQFLHAGLFPEPLVPVDASRPDENRDLARAVLAYREATRKSGAPDAVEPLLAFLVAHPESVWKPALQLNLGIIYRETGHFSKALSTWQAGWDDSQALKSRNGRDVANDTVAQLSQLQAYLGRQELLAPLLVSIKSRKIGGTAAQLLTDSRTGLYEMIHDPGSSFRCGPFALERILTDRDGDPTPATLRVLRQSRSTSHGLSLTMVDRIATQAGMHYQMAYRKPGSAVVVPAVVNWKVGHYAAVVERVRGGYLVADTTFGKNIRIGRSTLDQEASGYFLVPDGPLPSGWRTVSAAEGNRIWGRGNTGTNHAPPPPPPPPVNGCPGPGGCTTWSAQLQIVGLQLHDQPVGYTPPVGPAVRFDLDYSHRDTQQPATFSYTNFGPKWTFTWLSYITDDVNSTASATLYGRGGGSEPFSFSSGSATSSYPGPYSQGLLTRTVSGGNSTSFTLTFPDGSFEQFDQAVGNQFFMTAVGDPQGNKVTLTYDGQMRIVGITDAVGQVTTLSYGLSGSPLLVTEITDPFGRSATFTYNASGQLASITDVLGITSSYTYGQGSDPDFINTLTTPYGSTTFTYGDSSTNSSLGDTRFLKTVDPLGRTTYVEFDQGVDAGDSGGGVLINPSLMPTGMTVCDEYLYYRNTFYFDPNQYVLATAGGSLNYSDATVYHWLHTSDGTTTSNFLESEKKPLENRVWYNYPEQPNCIYAPVSSGGAVINGASARPSAIGRVLDNGTTQLQTFEYNAEGNVTQATDAIGRQTTNTYATNGIDLLSTANTTNGADQVLETRTYNSQHEPLTITGANGRTSHYQYNTAGQATRYTDPLGHATAMTFDSMGHLQSVQGPITGQKYTYAYDNVGRVAAATDPAGSTVRYTYDAADRLISATYPDGTSIVRSYNLLDLASVTDRLGNETQYSYDSDRELIEITDRLSHTVQMGYNPAGTLDSLTDQNSHTTTWTLDAESRVTGKQYADGTAESIAYESSDSLVAQVTDALGQTTTYGYNSDDTVSAIGYYSNQSTPGVSYTYDPAYERLTSMTDGTGTTTYSYYPVPSLGANQLESVTSPVAGTSNTDTVAYSYDALNRVVGMSVDGAAQAIGYDGASRITSESNPLDAFTYSYADATPRVTAVASSHGPALAMSYYGPQGDELLEQITATSGGTTLDQLGYTYNSNDNVTGFSVSSPTSQTTDYSYDNANRLLSGLIGSGTPQYQYAYDPASNLTSITQNGSTQNYTYTAANAIAAGTYDANGSPTALNGNTYTWDGANRLISFTGSSGTTSTFTYNGLGRLVRVVDSNSGTVVADHSYLWCGAALCLAHDNTQSGSPVSTQYFPQGAIISGTSYYYVQDRQGSVRELVTASGTVATQYDYDPYGNPTLLSGTVGSDIGYAGYFYHAASGLEFTLTRAYDPLHARWLNRDPIGELSGTNLYTYTGGNPESLEDPLGLYSAATVTLPDGTQYVPVTYVKNQAQANALGLPIGTLIPILVPPGTCPQNAVNAWLTLAVATPPEVLYPAFAAYWASPSENYKVAVSPIYDAYGNFEFGATGAAAGIALNTLQTVADQLHGGTNSSINTQDIQSGYNAIYAGGTLGTFNYTPPSL